MLHLEGLWKSAIDLGEMNHTQMVWLNPLSTHGLVEHPRTVGTYPLHLWWIPSGAHYIHTHVTSPNPMCIRRDHD